MLFLAREPKRFKDICAAQGRKMKYYDFFHVNTNMEVWWAEWAGIQWKNSLTIIRKNGYVPPPPFSGTETESLFLYENKPCREI